MRPKKHLGQHFLTSPGAITAMVTTADLAVDNYVIEIGPGKGVLTEALLKTGAHVVAYEKDPDMVSILKERFKEAINTSKLKIIEGDILTVSENDLHTLNSYKVVANIPYYITNAIIERFLSSHYQPQTMVLLLQHEVAERICAKEKRSILSLAVQVYAHASYIMKVKAGSFFPVPKVDSAIIALKDISRKNFKNCDESSFFKLIKSAFAHKRKVVINNIKHLLSKEDLKLFIEKDLLTTSTRAEDIPLDSWLEIASKVN